MTRKDELTWEAVRTAFATTDKIMAEHGCDAGAIDHEYMRRAIERLWTDQSREDLRAKVQAAVSIEIDGLFDAIGDDPAERQPAYADLFDDPEFKDRASALIVEEQRRFDEWLARDDFDPLIDEALKAGKEAHKVATDQGGESGGFSTYAMVDLGHRRAKPLVQALSYRGLGAIEPGTYTFDITSNLILEKRRRRGDAYHALAAKAAVEAFALVMSRPGFEFLIHVENWS